MPPTLAQYQTAANSIYEPQKAAESASLTTALTSDINTLEAQKGQISTDYQSAIEKLTQSVQDQSAQINQLYSQRLGGNFSGLQGNDMGQMFSRANQTQGIIEQTRLNKLGQITAGETNARLKYNTDISNLTSKYGSLESQYAQGAYADAVKSYQDNQYKQAQLAISQQRANTSASKTSEPKPLTQQQTAAAIRQGLNTVRGGDGYVSPQDYAQAYRDWVDSGFSGDTFKTQFADLRNPDNGYYDYAISQA